MKPDKKLTRVKQSFKQSPKQAGISKRQAVAHNTPPKVESKRMSAKRAEADRTADNK